MTTTKRNINLFCTKNNHPLPKFSGKSKTIYYISNVSYIVEQNLIEFARRIGYRIIFN